jgi:hypothetical protein
MRMAWLLGLGACTVAAPQHIVDSSGAPFALRADGRLDIVAGTPAPAPCKDAGRAVYAWALGRFISIGSACAQDDGSWTTIGNRERPVACTTTDDCPQWNSWSFECRSGLCQNADTTQFPPLFVNWDMANLLCHAPFPRADTLDPLSPTSVQVYQATTSVCSSTASNAGCMLPLPPTCWQLEATAP